MILDVDRNGNIVLREVSEAAWNYIQSERECTNTSPEHWIFGHEIYDGTVYVTVTPTEDKTEIVRITDKLIRDYGMKTTVITAHALLFWRREAAQALGIKRLNEISARLEKRVWSLKRILLNGCNSCTFFREIPNADDSDGYCMATGKYKLLDGTPLSCEYGSVKEGVRYTGVKYFPCKECKYLNEEKKI